MLVLSLSKGTLSWYWSSLAGVRTGIDGIVMFDRFIVSEVEIGFHNAHYCNEPRHK